MSIHVIALPRTHLSSVIQLFSREFSAPPELHTVARFEESVRAVSNIAHKKCVEDVASDGVHGAAYACIAMPSFLYIHFSHVHTTASIF